MTQGWEASAQAWIEVIGSEGDWGRRYVLDAPMLQRVRGRGIQSAVDIGCGEGRFCRMLKAEGIDCIGIDPTLALIEQARRCDLAGDYRIAGAESLPLQDASCDLAVFYLSLIDIAELDAALAEAHRVLKPGGSLLIANLQGFNTAAVGQGESVTWIAWQGIRIANHHRPLQRYLQALLSLGFELRHFAEPAPVGVAGDKADRYRRAPNFLLMEWERR